MLFKYQPRIDNQFVPTLTPVHSSVGKICFSSHHRKKNKSIRSLFQKEITMKSGAILYWNQFVDDLKWEKVWLLPNLYLVTNKIKEVSFKLIHRVYPVKVYCKRFRVDIDPMCTFCGNSPETAVHLFWYCRFIKTFWFDFCDFIHINIDKDFILYWKNVLFGCLETRFSSHVYVCNLLILLAKFHIHKCKFTNRKPLLLVFLKEFKQYISSIFFSDNTKAIKTINLCTLFKIPG